MKLLHELQHRMLEYIEGKEALPALREWFAPISLEIESFGDHEAVRTAYGMQRNLADYSEGFLSEIQLKQNMVALLYPSPFISSYVSGGVLGCTQPIVTTGTFIEVGSVPSIGVGPALVHA